MPRYYWEWMGFGIKYIYIYDRATTYKIAEAIDAHHAELIVKALNKDYENGLG